LAVFVDYDPYRCCNDRFVQSSLLKGVKMARTIVFNNKQKGRPASLINFLAKETKKPKWQKRGWKPSNPITYPEWSNDGQTIHQAGERIVQLAKFDEMSAIASVSSIHPYKILIKDNKRSQDRKDIEEMIAGFRSKKEVLIEIE
jgi:hypothetical protein